MSKGVAFLMHQAVKEQAVLASGKQLLPCERREAVYDVRRGCYSSRNKLFISL